MMLSWLFFILNFCLAAEPTHIWISPGEQKIIPWTGRGSLTVVNPKAVRVAKMGSKIQIIGKQPGVSRVIDSRGSELEVIVYSSKLKDANVDVATWLKGTFGIEMIMSPQKILLSGEVYKLADWRALQKLKKIYGSQISSTVEPSRQLLQQLADSTNPAEKRAIQEFNQEFDEQKVELRPMVEVEIVIAEVKKSSLSSLGLQLPGSYSATVLPSGDLTSAVTHFDEIPIKLNAGFQKGAGKVLASPKLLCRSGEVAHFVAGGEIPIKILNWRTSDVVWKRYGVILDITPKADLRDRISTKLTTEVSLLDDAHKVDGIPGLFTNRIETHFDLQGSKTIALSGLIKSELGRNTSGVSLLGEIPILGELFKSRDYRDNRTELVVFVTPRVISPIDPPAPPPAPSWSDD